MSPLVLVALAAVGGTMLLMKRKPLDPHNPNLQPDGPTGAVSTLEKGRSYTVQCAVDVTKAPITRTPAAVSEYLKFYFGNVGFNLRSQPLPLNAEEAGKVTQGLPALFTFIGQWTKDEKFISTPNPAVPNAQFILLPIA